PPRRALHSLPTRRASDLAAFSDALKRAAVKFGIGRFLYRLPAQWVDYDPQRRQFVRPPTLPASILSAREAEKPPRPEPRPQPAPDRKSTRLNSSDVKIS